MARLFTTRFTFNHQNYDAIVTVLTREGQLNFTVRLMDDELFELLPDGHLNYTGEDGFKTVHAGNHLVQSLIESIAFSVETHLRVQP